MELTEVQKEANSAGNKAIVGGIVMCFGAGLFGWMLAHLVNSGPETQPVVVALTDIPPLSKIEAGSLKVVMWPADSLPHGTFQKPEAVLSTGEININGLLAGEPIIAERLSTPDRGLGMSQMVEPNMRAYVIRVDDQVATSEIMHPGANVDVIASLEDPKNREPVTKVILQNVQILGVGDSIDVERAAPRGKDESASINRDMVERHRVVTLLVPLAEVETLSFAARNGKLDLTLRNNNDVNVLPTKGVTFDKLLGRNRDAQKTDAPPGTSPAPAPTSPGSTGHRSRGHHSDDGPEITKVRR